MRVNLQIAELSLGIICPDDFNLPANLAGFEIEAPSVSDCRIIIRDGVLPSISFSQRPIFADFGYKVFRTATGYDLLAENVDRSCYAWATIRQDFGQIDLLYDSTRAFDAVGNPMCPFGNWVLKTIVYNLLICRRKGMAFHSSAVDAGGVGLLFLGASGAGKSTMASVWSQDGQAAPLSDEINAVCRSAIGGLQIHGTPISSSAGLYSNRCVRLGGIYFLRHGRENDLRSVSKGDATKRLFHTAYTCFVERSNVGFILDFVEELVGSAPCYEYSFAPDASAVEYLKRVATPGALGLANTADLFTK